MRLLFHTCCGPCTTGALDWARGEFNGVEMLGFFYNPNIHPDEEYRRRRQSMQRAAQLLELPLVVTGEEEGLVDYLRQVAFREADRCRVCYAMRLGLAAQYAAKENFDAFSTTLLISPYQDQQAIRLVGEALSKLHGPDFIFRDLRPFYRLSRTRAKEMGLYRQKYCGCIFSELDRLRARLNKIAKKSPQTTPRPIPQETDSFGFNLSRLDAARAPSLPMNRARPFTLAGLDPEATAKLLASVAQPPPPGK